MVEILWIFLDVELKSIMSDGYNVYVFIGDELKSARFKDTVHPICMFHANNKVVKAANQGRLMLNSNVLFNKTWFSIL